MYLLILIQKMVIRLQFRSLRKRNDTKGESQLFVEVLITSIELYYWNK